MNSRLREIERLHLGLLAAAACTAYLTGWLEPASLLLGGIVMLVNLRLLGALVARVIAPDRTRKPATAMALILAKLALFVGLVALLMSRLPLDPLAFALGTTTLLVAITLSALRAPAPAHS